MEVLLFCWECLGVAFKALIGGFISIIILLLVFKVLRPPKRIYSSTSHKSKLR